MSCLLDFCKWLCTEPPPYSVRRSVAELMKEAVSDIKTIPNMYHTEAYYLDKDMEPDEGKRQQKIEKTIEKNIVRLSNNALRVAEFERSVTAEGDSGKLKGVLPIVIAWAVPIAADPNSLTQKEKFDQVDKQYANLYLDLLIKNMLEVLLAKLTELKSVDAKLLEGWQELTTVGFPNSHQFLAKQLEVIQKNNNDSKAESIVTTTSNDSAAPSQQTGSEVKQPLLQ